MIGAATALAMPVGRGGPDVVTFGEALVVFVASPGEPLASATRFRRTVAGAELNVAAGLARLGHEVSFIGRVGDDPHGQLVLRALRAERVNTDGLLVDPAAPTGMLVRDAHADRPVTVTYFRAGSAGSRLRAEQVTGHTVSSARILVATGITAILSPSAREATFAAVQTARDAGVLVVVDPNIRRKLAPLTNQLDDLRRLCAFADVVIAGEDEAAAISGISGPDRRLRASFWTVAASSSSSSAVRPGPGPQMARAAGRSLRSRCGRWIRSAPAMPSPPGCSLPSWRVCLSPMPWCGRPPAGRWQLPCPATLRVPRRWWRSADSWGTAMQLPSDRRTRPAVRTIMTQRLIAIIRTSSSEGGSWLE
jgi:sugar/nucleoside kinase (ribokinase family)